MRPYHWLLSHPVVSTPDVNHGALFYFVSLPLIDRLEVCPPSPALVQKLVILSNGNVSSRHFGNTVPLLFFSLPSTMNSSHQSLFRKDFSRTHLSLDFLYFTTPIANRVLSWKTDLLTDCTNSMSFLLSHPSCPLFPSVDPRGVYPGSSVVLRRGPGTYHREEQWTTRLVKRLNK